jgi:hypothetical protein
MATIKGASILRGTIIPDSAIEIDDSELEPGKNGRHANSIPRKAPVVFRNKFDQPLEDANGFSNSQKKTTHQSS